MLTHRNNNTDKNKRKKIGWLISSQEAFLQSPKGQRKKSPNSASQKNISHPTKAVTGSSFHKQLAFFFSFCFF